MNTRIDEWIKNYKRRRRSESNLVIISFDQWRGDWGNPYKQIVPLRNIGKIAKNGLTMSRCYANSPQCVPSRFSWITGLEPSQLGVTKNEDVSLPDDAPSLIRELKKSGWHTSIVGKTHWSTHNKKKDLRNSKNLIENLGFEKVIEIAGPRALQIIECQITEDWDEGGVLKKQRKDLRERYKGGMTDRAWASRETVLPNHLYPDIWIANKAKEEIKRMPKSQPWLLWISFVGPHEPFDTPRPWRGRTSDDQLPKAIKKREWITKLDKSCSLSLIERKWKNKVSDYNIRELRRDYADHLLLLDEMVGEITSTLESRNDYKKTAIAIMADHGEMLGDGGMLYKSTFLESSIQVPMIYKPPGKITTAIESKKVINLTGALRVILKNLKRGGGIKPIITWANSENGAVVEYDNEYAFIRKNQKLCTDRKGNIIWATNVGKDPKELTNAAQNKDIRGDIRWSKIIKWSKYISNKRNKKEWIWRDLINSHHSQE